MLPATTPQESADDVEDLRHALGAAKISLVGHSYLSELALSVIRSHGDAVERAVLASVEGPGDHDTLPSVLDLQLKKIARLVADDATIGKEFPDPCVTFPGRRLEAADAPSDADDNQTGDQENAPLKTHTRSRSGDERRGNAVHHYCRYLSLTGHLVAFLSC